MQSSSFCLLQACCYSLQARQASSCAITTSAGHACSYALLLTSAGKGGPAQQDQARLWKAFLEYERSNPQRLEQSALTQRVELAYMQALMCLLHFPEVGSGLRVWGARVEGSESNLDMNIRTGAGIHADAHVPAALPCGGRSSSSCACLCSLITI
jgi:hypothetical protein